MKKYGKNIIILVLVTVFIMYLVMKDDFSNIMNNILNANIEFLFCGLFLMIFYVFFQALSINLYLKEIKPNYKLKDSFILMSTAMFFNAITPFSSGGQPFQVYLLRKQKIKVTESTNALLQNFISYQIGLILMGIIAIILNNIFHIIPQTSLLKNIVLIGFAINTMVLFILLFLANAKKANKKIFDFIFSFKFMRNKESLKENMQKKIEEFYNSSVYFKKNKSILIKSIFFNMLSLICLYSVPIFIFFSLGEMEILNIIDSIVCSSYTYFIGSFVPIPGGTGGLEYAFLEFFKVFNIQSSLSACMILWRFITYYLTMILGAISIIFVRKDDE